MAVTPPPLKIGNYSIVEQIGVDEAAALLGGGTLEGGILPKLGAAITAARGGVAASIGRTQIPAAVAA